MKCGSRECSNEATHEIFWPGQVAALCDSCTEGARAIGQRMGITLKVEPAPERDRVGLGWVLSLLMLGGILLILLMICGRRFLP